MQIAWASSDLPLLDASSRLTLAAFATTTSADTTTTSIDSRTTAAMTPADAENPSGSASTVDPASDRLSSGASAGLGVGVAIGVLLLVGASFWLYYRKRKSKKSPRLQGEASQVQQWAGDAPLAYESPGDIRGHQAPKHEEGVTFEMSSDRQRAELQGS